MNKTSSWKGLLRQPQAPACTAQFNAQGELLRIKGLARDVSRRKRAEDHQSQLMPEHCCGSAKTATSKNWRETKTEVWRKAKSERWRLFVEQQ